MSAIADRHPSTEHHPDPTQDCGICQKPGGEVIWVSPYSWYAHRTCVESIEKAARPLIEALNRRYPFPDDPKEALKNFARWNKAHSEGVGAVKRCCAPLSLRAFQEERGVEALMFLFNTVGVQGARGWRSRL